MKSIYRQLQVIKKKVYHGGRSTQGEGIPSQFGLSLGFKSRTT